jgi:hypothetical protein
MSRLNIELSAQPYFSYTKQVFNRHCDLESISRTFLIQSQRYLAIITSLPLEAISRHDLEQDYQKIWNCFSRFGGIPSIHYLVRSFLKDVFK